IAGGNPIIVMTRSARPAVNAATNQRCRASNGQTAAARYTALLTERVGALTTPHLARSGAPLVAAGWPVTPLHGWPRPARGRRRAAPGRPPRRLARRQPRPRLGGGRTPARRPGRRPAPR